MAESRSDRFDRADFGRRAEREAQSTSRPAPNVRPSVTWPIDPVLIVSVGDTVMAERKKRGKQPQPHNGLDIKAKAGTPVRAALSGRVVRITDGRTSKEPKKRAAGLWVDIEGTYLARYLHLGSRQVELGQVVGPGDLIGTIAAAHTSGLAGDPHLHFELREVLSGDRGYGPPINPLRVLPPRTVG